MCGANTNPVRVHFETLLKPAEDVISRMIAGEMILVPIRRSAAELGSIYTLNATGARIWSLMNGENTLGKIRNIVVDEYEIDPAQAWSDLVRLSDSLLLAGAVREV